MVAPASVLLSRLLARGKFRHLQVLLRLAELGSVQRTADAIGVTLLMGGGPSSIYAPRAYAAFVEFCERIHGAPEV